MKRREVISNVFNEYKNYSSQIFKLATADLKKTYNGSALGWAWAVIKPLTTILVFWFAFSMGLRSGKNIYSVPYVLWIIAGMVPWFFLREMLTEGAGALRRYKHLVTKMTFPISTIPGFVNIAHFYVHLFLLGLMIIIYNLLGVHPSIYYLQLPIYLVLIFLFGWIWAFFSSLLSAMSKDFLNFVKSSTSALFWLSAVMWDVNLIPARHHWVRVILKFNPVTFFSEGYRNVFVFKKWIWENPTDLACILTVYLFFAALGLWAYRKLIKEIPDVI